MKMPSVFTALCLTSRVKNHSTAATQSEDGLLSKSLIIIETLFQGTESNRCFFR